MSIDYKKIWFASKTAANENFFNETINRGAPIELMKSEDKKDWTILDFIENQDDFMYQTKKQCTLVEHSSTSRGTQTFDLPSNLKGQRGPDRARKDSYSALLLVNWMMNLYYDMNDLPPPQQYFFSPMFIK